MSVEMINRTDPEYVKALIEKKPHKDDPKEVRITDVISKEVLREQWARDAFSRVGEIQINYLREMLVDLPNANLVHDKTQQTLEEISKLLHSTIVEGQEHVDGLPKGQSVLIATNHFGAYKLLGINPQQELGVRIEGYDFLYPYPMYFAAFSPVAEALGDNLYYVSDDFPLVFGDIHREAGFINVPPAKVVTQGRTGILEEQTRSLLETHPHAAIVNYPEGGTSGKYSGLGPYDLDPFKTGAYVIAAHLGIPILPVAQYFDPQEGFKLRVFEPVILDPKGTPDYFSSIAQGNQEEMQAWLNQRIASTTAGK